MTDTPSTAEDRALDALTKILEAAISPEMTEAQQIILRRLALAGDLFPSRVPPPANITQVGGYLNLVADDPVLSAQVLAAALGVAGPNPSPGYDPTLPALYFVTRRNDRPAGPAQPSTPVQIRVRSDFAVPFDAAMVAIHDVGATLPVLSGDGLLPPLTLGGQPPVDLLPYLGRELRLVPGAALVDPSTDPLAVGRLGGGGPEVVVARQLDAAAPGAGSLTADTYALWTCDATTCTSSSVTGAFLPIGPVLAAAGWSQADPLPAPSSTSVGNGWDRFVNVTGLVPGVSTFGEELRLLYQAGQIAASSVRECQDWLWNGTAFAAPA